MRRSLVAFESNDDAEVAVLTGELTLATVHESFGDVDVATVPGELTPVELRVADDVAGFTVGLDVSPEACQIVKTTRIGSEPLHASPGEGV